MITPDKSIWRVLDENFGLLSGSEGLVFRAG